MRRRFLVLGVVFGLILATVSGTHAAEMPSVDDLQAQMEAPAGTVTVYEPHLSVGDAHDLPRSLLSIGDVRADGAAGEAFQLTQGGGEDAVRVTGGSVDRLEAA